MITELKDLKVGDEVIYQRKSDGPDRIKEITRVTNTMIVIDDGTRFSRKDGFAKGGHAWDYSRIYVATYDKIESILAREYKDGLIRKIKSKKLDDMPAEILEEVLSLFNSLS